MLWTNKGYLVLVYGFGFSAVANLITRQVTGSEEYWKDHSWPLAVGLVLASLACFLSRDKTLENPRTFLLINMQRWAFLFLVLSLGHFAYGGNKMRVVENLGYGAETEDQENLTTHQAEGFSFQYNPTLSFLELPTDPPSLRITGSNNAILIKSFKSKLEDEDLKEKIDQWSKSMRRQAVEGAYIDLKFDNVRPVNLKHAKGFMIRAKFKQADGNPNLYDYFALTSDTISMSFAHYYPKDKAKKSKKLSAPTLNTLKGVEK